MKLSVLSSGSGGNACYVESGGTRLLVDAGLGYKELTRRLAPVANDARPEQLDALLLTHEHGDHAACASVLASRGLPVFATSATAEALALDPACTSRIERAEGFAIGALRVTPVPVPHDAADPVGFLVEGHGIRLGLLTDCGHVADEVVSAYAGCDVLLLEANHDREMLEYGSYPRSLKRRIGGRMGHLSNDEAASFLRRLPRPLPRVIVLAHLSQMNNRPALARAAALRAVGRAPVRLFVASQGTTLTPIALGTGSDGTFSWPGEQLALPLLA